jgi:hypothetical protein
MATVDSKRLARFLSPLNATFTKKGGGVGRYKGKSRKAALPPASDRSSELVDLLALDESFFQHLLVAEPQIGDIG